MQWLRANFISDACCVVRTFDICILIAKMQKQTKKKKTVKTIRTYDKNNFTVPMNTW